MGLDEAGAVEALTALRTWFVERAEQIATARRAVNQARSDLRAGWRQVHQGKAGDKQAAAALIQRLESAARQATEAYEQLTATAVPAVEAKLSAGQVTTWRTIRANVQLGATGDYVYAPSLTADQVKSLRTAERTRQRRLAAAETDAQRGEAAATFRSAETAALSAAQRETIAAARLAARTSAPAVLAADAKILPVPQELLPEEPAPPAAAEPAAPAEPAH